MSDFEIGDRIVKVKPYTWSHKPHPHYDDIVFRGVVMVVYVDGIGVEWDNLTEEQQKATDSEGDRCFADGKTSNIDSDCVIHEEDEAPTPEEIAEVYKILGVKE